MSDLFLALDDVPVAEALRLSTLFSGKVRAVKIHNLLDAEGPGIIQKLRAGGNPVWVDYKIHDTPDTVALRVASLAMHGARFISVHASGGVRMLRAAIKAAGERAEIFAITALTSLDEQDIARIYGAERNRNRVVLDLAHIAYEAGVRTVVCSAQEVALLKTTPELVGLRCVVPGTRSQGVALGQQKRSGTPAQAIVDGADGLVVGSQVIKAADPVGAFQTFVAEIADA